MSKRLEILENKYDLLSDEIAGIETRYENIKKRERREKRNILKKYIASGYGNFKTIYHDTSMKVIYGENSDGYSVLDAYVYDSWKGDNREYNRIDYSTSSFRTEMKKGTDMNWVKDRFAALAFYAEQIENSKDKILAEFNLIEEKYFKLCTAIHELKKPLRNERSEISGKIDRLKDEIMMDQLFSKDGLMIEPEKDDNYLPRFQVKFDWELNSVKSIRGVKKSASGKSVDLQVSVRRGWGDDKKLEVIDVDRVRFDNVRSFIRRNKNVIV